MTPANRSAIETALDALIEAVDRPADTMAAWRARQEYLKAIRLVRERPAGDRQLRSDYGHKRQNPRQLSITTP